MIGARRPLFGWACALAASCAAAAFAAGTPKPITFADLPGIKEPKVSILDWSRDSKALYLADREPAATSTLIAKLDLASGRQAALGEFAGQGFSISPREDFLVHFDAGEWKAVEIATGKSETLFKSPGFQFLPVAPQWSRDGRYLAVLELVQPEGMPRLDPATIEAKDGVRVIDAGAAADQMMRKLGGSAITVIDMSSRKVAFKLQETLRVLDVSWGLGDRLYYGYVDDGDLATPHSYVTEVVISSRAKRTIAESKAMIQPFRTSVSPDGKMLATAFDFARPQQDNFKSIVLVDLATLEKRRLTGPDRAGNAYSWMGDGKSIVYTERSLGLTHLARVHLDGRTVVLTHDQANAMEMRLSPDSSRAAYVTRDVYGGVQVKTVATAGGEPKVVREVVNYRDRFALGTFESARYKAADGVDLHGYLFKPADFDPAKKYPVIVDIHGGGIGAALFLFGPIWALPLMNPLEWHAWTQLGYVVLVPEMRSSGECGEAAAYNDFVKDAGGLEGDIQDIAAATDWILSRPYIDPTRAALFGLSAGGGRVNKFLTVDHRYAAGIILDPIRSGPLESLITQALPPYTGVKIGPQPCLDAIARGDTSKCSPGFLFDGVYSTTPTLIFVGNQEMGAVLGFSMDVLFTTLRKRDVPARMLRYMAEGHGANSWASSAHKTEEMRLWLEKYVLRTTSTAQWRETPSGLRYAITSRGNGAAVRDGEVIVAHYAGRLESGAEFDSSFKRKQPIAFTLGSRQVIGGWDEGFALMHVGDKATLVIPAALAYGEKGRPPLIPPNATLTFDVELVEVHEHSLAGVLAEALEKGGVDEARRRYEEQQRAGFADSYVSESQLNGLGYRLLAEDKPAAAIAVFEWTAERFPASANAYDSLGEALAKSGSKDRAIASYRRALAIDPSFANAAQELARLEAR